MVSRRIKLIASLLNSSDNVLDVGTDHALLPIYLKQNNLVNSVDASDISSNVLVTAKNNLIKYELVDQIKLYHSDGLKNVDVSSYNTLVICGMGFSTIKSILDNEDLSTIKKMIIQTNNHYEDFRKYITSINYKITDEIWIFDQEIDYLIFKVEQGIQELDDAQISCGIYNHNNIEYYKKMVDKLNELLDSIPDDLSSKRSDIMLKIKYYNSYIFKEKTEE